MTFTPALTIIMPWPDAALSPNSRGRWAKIKEVTAAREMAYLATMDQIHWIAKPIPAGVMMRVTFHRPNNRRMDLDNLVGRCKAYQDGIFSALGWDDALIVEARYIMGQVIPEGSVCMTIEVENE